LKKNHKKKETEKKNGRTRACWTKDKCKHQPHVTNNKAVPISDEFFSKRTKAGVLSII